MEKKGEVLSQLAIIADLIEKVNIDYNTSTLIFNVNEKEFENVYNYMIRRHSDKFVSLKPDINDFSLLMGEVKIIFNKNSA